MSAGFADISESEAAQAIISSDDAPPVTAKTAPTVTPAAGYKPIPKRKGPRTTAVADETVTVTAPSVAPIAFSPLTLTKEMIKSNLNYIDQTPE